MFLQMKKTFLEGLKLTERLLNVLGSGMEYPSTSIECLFKMNHLRKFHCIGMVQKVNCKLLAL